MEKKRKSYRKIKNQQKFILILITCVLIIAAIFLGSKLAKKRVNNLQTNPKVENQDGTSSNSLKEQEDKNNSNNEDNKLFDENIESYAEAIAKGIIETIKNK